ncbi:MAG: adenosylmethionine--8-amino-7-oxononanoate transaminase [Rhodospirillaceae bacterium TMED8]|nr:adenosylmethionine--8-amino-7-oxononanoate transaminase [Magnetovibrio sp.]OUT50775.1 MAG: adenosylmethionine--8-amino-7-oxononanoate transaminase [Rhodospirillaceae bacterium TMED8]
MTLKKCRPGWFAKGYNHIWLPYTQMHTSPLPQVVKSTHDTRIVLNDGTELIDGIASWWSACHGYNHHYIREAVVTQLENMPHVMLAGLSNEPAYTLASRLAALTPGQLSRVFFSESGSVSVELAMKMAVQYWINTGQSNRKKFISFKNGYHGDTIGTMGIGETDNIMHGPFSGLMTKQRISPLPATFESQTDFEIFVERHAETTAAVIMEPLVQGAGGMVFHEPAVVKFVREICDRHSLLFILDEIMVGFGRTGTLFACEQASVTPDIMTLSKSLTGGTMALAATIATNHIFDAFLGDTLETCLMHGPTYTGNALACAAANASIDLFESEPRLLQVAAIESHLKDALKPCKDIDGVKDVRVKGAIGVVELEALGDMYWIRQCFIDKGCWVRPFGNVIYLMPAFTIEMNDLKHLTRSVVEVTEAWSEQRHKWT